MIVGAAIGLSIPTSSPSQNYRIIIIDHIYIYHFFPCMQEEFHHLWVRKSLFGINCVTVIIDDIAMMIV